MRTMNRASTETTLAAAAPQGAERRSGSIDLHVSEVARLCDSLDPCPIYERAGCPGRADKGCAWS
jgi:hypothetical protein